MGGVQSVQSKTNTSQWYDRKNENDMKISSVATSSIKKSDLACSHNTRKGVSAMDLVEHGFNEEYGSAIRDLVDVITGKEEISGVDEKSNTRNVS